MVASGSMAKQNGRPSDSSDKTAGVKTSLAEVGLRIRPSMFHFAIELCSLLDDCFVKGGESLSGPGRGWRGLKRPVTRHL